jgi:hypothetical protein
MNGDEAMRSGPEGCGGCDTTPAAPEIRNRPGLSAIAYRVGTYATFVARLHAALSDARRPALLDLATRESEDLSIALLDAFATMADVLTFYQERIANESYLRTAIERRSVVEQTRLLGYELNPGVAASTWLAFEVEAAAAMGEVRVPERVRVQSVPGPDEAPQVYETTGSIQARAAWNVLRPRRTRPQEIRFGTRVLWLAGTETRLAIGDPLLVVGRERRLDPGQEQWDLRRVDRLQPDVVAGRTRVLLDRPVGWLAGPHRVDPAQVEVEVRALRRSASLFGQAAPDWRTMPKSVQAAFLGVTSESAVAPRLDWPDMSLRALSDPPPEGDPRHGLLGEYFADGVLSDRRTTRIDAAVDFAWGSNAPAPHMPSHDYSVRWTGWVRAPRRGQYRFFTESDDGVRLWIDGRRLVDDWTAHATKENASEEIELEGGPHALRLEYFNAQGAATVRLRCQGPGLEKQLVPTALLHPSGVYTVHLDGSHPKIRRYGWVAFTRPGYVEVYRVEQAIAASRTDFGITAKTTRLHLSGEHLLEEFDEHVRETTALFEDEALPLAEVPLAELVEGARLELDGAVPALPAGRRVLVTGLTATIVGGEVLRGAPAVEVATVARALEGESRTTLELDAPLEHRYLRETMTIRANVAPATNGETVAREVLGSGDPARSDQRFALKQAPVTYTSAATPQGGLTTLEVYVDDVRWREVPNLLGQGPNDRVYVTRADETQHRTVQFGDGLNAARPPLGVENVVARYRKGLGSVGNVRAGQLSLLLTRPLGVSKVENPRPSDGAQDPQALEDARENAPLTVVTLDRIVSLEDYRSFCRAFCGIGKAHAAWTWFPTGRGVSITVAGPGGAPVPDGSALQRSLRDAIDALASVPAPVRVQTYRRVHVQLSATVLVEPDVAPQGVRERVHAALRTEFSFARRAFGQPVHLSEVIAAIQRIPGVRMVDLDRLARVPETGPASVAVEGVLDAAAPRDGDDAPSTPAAELLTIAADDPLDQVRVIP